MLQKKNILMQIAPGVIVKDAGIGWEDLTTSNMVKELPKVLIDNIIK